MCDICASPLLDELNKKRNWHPDRVIKWAGRRGLEITEPQLKAHFAEHLPQPSNNGHHPKTRQCKTSTKNNPDKECQTKPNDDITSPSQDTAVPDTFNRMDNLFLDEIVKRVFDNLVEGNFELKLEHGFKAIEIKQKLADKADNENMLLELLNEIRKQELS
jgi:hypothetical protein